MQYPKYVEPERLHYESDEVLSRKVEAILAEMTPEEILNLCHGHASPAGMQVANAGYHPGVPRLGVPEIRMYDGPAGVTSIYETTGLPVQEMLAAAWDLPVNIHLREATEDFFAVMRDCRHLHLPVQSGSDRILRAMNRGYDREKYLAQAAAARRMVSRTSAGMSGSTFVSESGLLYLAS